MAEKTVAMEAQAGQAEEGTRAQERFVKPAVDIYESPDGLTVVADLPGVRKEDLSIDVKDDVLTIEGKARPEPSADAIHREFQLASYFRQFHLADSVDVSRIRAELKNGVLTLHLPRPEQAKPRKIPVQAG